jgi:hypothetical protein
MSQTIRTISVRLALVGLGAFLPVAAQAQMRGGGMGGPTPLGTALEKVPVGTWAEYTVKRGDQPARKVRHALVGKEGKDFVLETKSEGQNGAPMISHVVVDPDPTKEGGVKKVVLQMGTNDPMEMPTAGRPGGGGGGGGDGNRGGGRGARFIKPDPKKLVGKETVKVPAGTFQAEHYRDEGPRGGTIDFWIAKDAGPLGFVKMESDRPGGDNDNGGKTVVELSAKGKGAKPEVTKAAKPMDPEMMREMFRGRGQGGGGPRPGGTAPTATPPAPAPTPAPAPKK